MLYEQSEQRARNYQQKGRCMMSTIDSYEILIRVGLTLIHKYSKSTGSMGHDVRTSTLKGLKEYYPSTIKEIEETAALVVERSKR